MKTFDPKVEFKNFYGFMEFAYYGGWLTPFIEHLGLQNAKPLTKAAINAIFFPIRDHHSIEIVLAQKDA